MISFNHGPPFSHLGPKLNIERIIRFLEEEHVDWIAVASNSIICKPDEPEHTLLFQQSKSIYWIEKLYN